MNFVTRRQVLGKNEVKLAFGFDVAAKITALHAFYQIRTVQRGSQKNARTGGRNLILLITREEGVAK